MTELEKAIKVMNGIIAMAKKNVLMITDDEERLKLHIFYPDWTEGTHEVGEIYNTEGQTWECFQAYDNAVYPDINPDNSAWFTFNRPLHGKSLETARPFVKPMGAHDMYHVGEYMIWTDGVVYKCVIDTVYTPDEYGAAWEKVIL